MSDFTAGFSARGHGVAEALKAAFAPRPGFAPADLRARAKGGAAAFSPADTPADGAPRHFSPADPGANPTAGWDPFDASPAAPPAPFIDPIAVAHATGYAEGIDHALAEAGEAHARNAALLADLGAALRSNDRIDRAAVARHLRQTVLALVTRLLGEVGIAPDLLARRIDAAADLLTDTAESAMLRVHPDDVALLEGKLPRSIFAVGDASVARGAFVLESASTIIEDGPELWLDQLAVAIDRVAVPQE